MKKRELVESYKKLFWLTGNPTFFMAYKTMQKTNTPILLPPLNENVEDNNLSL